MAESRSGEVDSEEDLRERKEQAIIAFVDTCSKFLSNKTRYDVLDAFTKDKKAVEETKVKKIKPIMKKSGIDVRSESKEQPKKVHFKDIPFETEPPSHTKEITKPSLKKGKKSIFKTQSEEELSSELQKKLATVLTKVDEFIKAEEKAEVKPIKKSVAKPISTLSQLDRIDVSRFIQRKVLADIVSRVYLYGESLTLSKEIQAKYEARPVPKNVFALFHEFQYPIVDSLPHSLQCVGSLGRILYMETLGYLQQIDVMGENRLSPYFLGIRMPLRYTPIIDTIVDSKSCRIYTLNALWKLEVWSLEQSSSLPIKRVPMVNCKVDPNCIEQTYKSRYMKSKPTFLSISESANQILVVNTSSVDGNIVFVDPISLSILKRIHFVFGDYEVSSSIKDAIDRLIACLALDLKSNAAVITLLKTFPKAAIAYSDFIEKVRVHAPNVDFNIRSFV